MKLQIAVRGAAGLYLMVRCPGASDEDFQALVDLLDVIGQEYRDAEREACASLAQAENPSLAQAIRDRT